MKRKLKKIITDIKDGLLNSRRTRKKTSLYIRQSQVLRGYAELYDEYRDSWLIQKICTMKAEDGLKNWIDIVADAKYDAQVKAVEDRIKELDVKGKLLQCAQFGDAYGGGAIVLNIADGLQDDDSVEIDRITELSSINAIERPYLPAHEYSDDLKESDYGQPVSFKTLNGDIYDASRVIRMVGVKLGKAGTIESSGYGDPLTHQMQEAIKSFAFATDGVDDLLIDYSTKVLSIEGLISKMLNDKSDLEARLELLNESTSIDGMLIISEKEDLKKITVSLAGVQALLDFTLDTVSGAGGYPRSKLFSQQLGTLAGGKEGTGDYIRNVEMYRDRKFTQAIQYILTILFSAEGVDIAEVEWSYNDVETISESQLIENQERSAKTASLLLQSGVISEEEARQAFVASTKSNAIKLNSSNIPNGLTNETE